MTTSLTHDRFAILACGTAVLMVLGLIYAWSIFVQPLEAEFGWSRSQTSLTFSVSMVLWSCGMLANGQLSKRLPLRVCFALGIGLIACGFVLTSFANQLWQVYLAYGVLCGFGTGLSYNLWMSSTFAHFPDKTGLASGVLLMGFGMGSMVLGSATSALIHSPLGWRGAMLILAGIALAVALLAMPFLHKPEKAKATATDPSSSQAAREDDQGLSGSQMIRQSSFWAYTLWKVLVMGAAAAIIAQAAPLMADLGASSVFCTTAVAALSVGNGCGRPIVGVLYDRLGRTRTMVALPALGILIGIGLFATYSAGSILGLALSLFAEGILYGGYATINTSFVRTVYGQRSVAMNIGISSFTLMPFNFAFPLILAALFMATGSYGLGLGALPVLAAISLGAALLCNRLTAKAA